MQTPTDRERWQAVLDREVPASPFLYGVTSTGIYCRPTCPARRPKAENVAFFDSSVEARAAGFRACLRCHPDADDLRDDDRDRVLRACRMIEESGGPVALADLAGATHWTGRGLQRGFAEILGTSPSAFASAVRTRRARQALRRSSSVTEAVYEVGYGSSRGFYEEAGSRLGVPPRLFLTGSPGTSLYWAVADTFVGPALVVTSDDGLCAVRLGDVDDNLATVAAEFPLAELTHAADRLAPVCEAIVAISRGREAGVPVPLDVRATAFEARVWAAVVRIPTGERRSYSQIAVEIGAPTATRAVASAIGRNPVALVIPCHRVTRADGALGGYRWGLEVKAELLADERLRRQPPGGSSTEALRNIGSGD